MGALDIFRAIGSIPRRINEARFNHANVNVPADIPINEPELDEMVTVGFDPDTDEPIQIPRSSLGGSTTKQVMQQKNVRTGPSKFGRFVSEGLPRMLDAGIAAATTPSNGMDHGVLGVLRGMDIGRDRLQKRDMLGYQTARQMRQDEIAEQERMSRAKENEAQAAWYRRRAEEETRERPQAPPSTWEASLVRQHAEAMQAGDMERANAIADQLNQLRSGGRAEYGNLMNVGGAIYDAKTDSWKTPPKPDTPKEPKPTYAQAAAEKTRLAVNGYLMRGAQDIEKAIGIAKQEDAPSEVQVALADMRRKLTAPKTGRNPITRTPTPSQAVAIAAEKEASNILAEAGQDFDKAIALAKAKNSSLRVQNLLVDAKKKAAPPRTTGRTNAVPQLGGGPAWLRHPAAQVK